MYFCFIVEAQYRYEFMPMAVVHKLEQQGHKVDLLEPQLAITCLSNFSEKPYDAYVLKTVSDGPGLSILEAAEAAGIPTINNSRAIRRVRNKAVAVSYAQAHGLPTPLTYFVSQLDLLSQIPAADYPLVVKPSNGSSCRDIYRVNDPADLANLQIAATDARFFLAQHYVENTGYDVKLYVAGSEVFAVAKKSPLHPEVKVEKRLIPLSSELQELALYVGKLFDLDIYGLDVVETRDGPMIVDINDFPSFGQLPHAVTLIASHIVRIAARQTNRLDRASIKILTSINKAEVLAQ
jgi:ribosomal protein S6--L-glutamate ligase